MKRLEKNGKNVPYIMLLVMLMCLLLTFGCESTTDSTGEEYEEGVSFALKFNPSSATIAGAGQTTDVDVVVENASGLITARFTMSFNPSLVEVTNIKISGSGFIFTDAGANVIPGDKSYDNETGEILVGVLAQKKDFAGADGDGIIAKITFKGKSTGSGNLSFIDSEDLDIYMGKYSAEDVSGFVEQSVKTYNGSITVQ